MIRVSQRSCFSIILSRAGSQIARPAAVAHQHRRWTILQSLRSALFWAVVGYAAGAVLGMLLVAAFSANRHDKDLELLMTGIFYTGPISGIAGFVLALAWPRRRGRKLEN